MWKIFENDWRAISCDLILMCCLVETANASLLNTIFLNAPVNRSQRLVHDILKDEVKHGQIGWAFLELNKGKDMSFVSEYLPAMLEIAVNDELFSSQFRESEEELSFGILPESIDWSSLQQPWNKSSSLVLKNIPSTHDQALPG